MKRCAKCQTTWYCNCECQKTNWKSHKKIGAMQAAGNNIGPSLDKTFADATNSYKHKHTVASGPNIDHAETYRQENIKNLEKHIPNAFTHMN
ncbi:hypothetical protein PSPO01_07708 [Paraphaeosphaeria sporulosa]